MKALVTGAAGFIGSHMAERLNDFGMEVIGIDNFSDYYDPRLKYLNAQVLQRKGIKIIAADLRMDDLKNLIPADLDYVFHFAAQPGLASSSTFAQYLENNITATQRLVTAIKDITSLRLFVNIGTSSIYGSNASLDEKALPQPISTYGITKLTAEQLVLSESRTGIFKACSLRLYSVYGPRERPDKLFTKLIQAGLNGYHFPLYEGSLYHLRSFTYVDDIIDGIMATIGREEDCNQQIFNIGTDNQYSTREGVETVEKILGAKIEFQHLPSREGDQQKTNAVIEKARRLLGYNPTTSLFDGIRKQVEWITSSDVKKAMAHPLEN